MIRRTHDVVGQRTAYLFKLVARECFFSSNCQVKTPVLKACQLPHLVAMLESSPVRLRLSRSNSVNLVIVSISGECSDKSNDCHTTTTRAYNAPGVEWYRTPVNSIRSHVNAHTPGGGPSWVIESTPSTKSMPRVLLGWLTPLQ